MSEDNNNPVFKLMADNLQLNVLIKFLNNKVSQGSVVTHLRCVGIIHNH